MKTVLTKLADEAARFIDRGGVVAFPTETVYGLGAGVFDKTAIERIFEAKQRPADNPLIAHIARLDQLADLAVEINDNAQQLIDAFFPGPLTIVLKKSEAVPLIATAGLDTIGVRMPRLPLARQFLSACSSPVAAPSANLSGRPSPTTWKAVFEDLDGRIDCILQSESTQIGIESTVVDCSSVNPRLLRSGSVSIDQLRAIVPGIEIFDTNDSAAPRSPGLRHRHYSPTARVVEVENVGDVNCDGRAGFIGLSGPPRPCGLELICPSVDDYARSVFEFFRECDRHSLDIIYCQRVEESGIGAALMDRIRRAAAK